MKKENMTPLTKDMLEHVNGGYHTEGAQTEIDEKVGALKKKYKTQKKTTDYLIKNYTAVISPRNPMTKKEVMNYVKENWDLI